MKRVSPDTSSGFCVATASALAALVAAVAATAIATAAAVATISGTGAGSSLATAIFIAAVLAAAASGLLATCIAGPPVQVEASPQIVLPLTTLQESLKTLVDITKSRPPPRPIRRRPAFRRRLIPDEPGPPPPPPVRAPSSSATLAFHERCGRILQTCNLLVRHFPTTRTLCILRTAGGIIARRPTRAVEPEPAPAWESDIDVDLDPVLSAPNLDEALRRLDQSIRSAKKYKERNDSLHSTSLVLEAEKRRNTRWSHQYLVGDAQALSSAISEDVLVDAQHIPKPKARCSLLQPTHPTETDSFPHVPSPETNEILLKVSPLCNTQSFTSSQNDVSSSFVEKNSEQVSIHTGYSALSESDISSSSCVKETENVALSSTLTEGPSSSAEVHPENEVLLSIPVQNELRPPILAESKALLSNNLEKEAEIVTPPPNLTETEGVSSSHPEIETDNKVFSPSEAVLSSFKVDAENESSAPISSAIAKTEAPYEDTRSIAEAVPSSFEGAEPGTVSHSSTTTGRGCVSPSSDLVQIENNVISPRAEDAPPSSILGETENVPLLTDSVPSSCEGITDNTNSLHPATSQGQADDVAVSACSCEVGDKTSAPIENFSDREPVSSSENLALIPDVLNDVPLTEVESSSSDNLSVNSDVDSSNTEAVNPIDEPDESHPEKTSASEQTEDLSLPPPPVPNRRVVLHLNITGIAPSNIDQEFEELLENISPPNDDIDKTFSAVSSDISALDGTCERNCLMDITALDQSITEDDQSLLPVEEASIYRAHVSVDDSKISESDVEYFPDLNVQHACREGSDFAGEHAILEAKTLTDTNFDNEKESISGGINDPTVQRTNEDINNSLVQLRRTNLAAGLEPATILFDVHSNTTQENIVCEKCNESAVEGVELHSDSLNEREINFDRGRQSFIEDNLDTEVISDCASDSSSKSVSPNSDISFFKTESSSVSCEVPENTQPHVKRKQDGNGKKADEDLKKMDSFGFGEPLMIVTARKVRTYVDDAEQFQKRLERKKRRLRIYPEDISQDLEAKPATAPDVLQPQQEPETLRCFEPVTSPRETSTCKLLRPEALRPGDISHKVTFQETEPVVAQSLQESDSSHSFKPVAIARKNNTCQPLKPAALQPFSKSPSTESSPCSDALPEHFFRSLERREESRLTTFDHSSEFPLNMRVPHRRAFWDNKLTERNSESPKHQPSIKITGIVQKCKETLQTLSGSSESLSTVAIDEEELPRSHRRKFQEARCFFQNLEGRDQPMTPSKPATLEASEKRKEYPATVEERFNVTGIYRDVLGAGAAKTAAGAPLRGVPRRKAVIATLDSFRK